MSFAEERMYIVCRVFKRGNFRIARGLSDYVAASGSGISLIKRFHLSLIIHSVVGVI